MYVVSFEYFINMRSVQSHQELLSLDILVEFTEEIGDSIFVSHQWLGAAHPDPNFQQLRVLQRAMDQMIGGQALLKSTVTYAFLAGGGTAISTKEWRSRSNFLFIWYDYFSCPQWVARSTDQKDLQELQNAVDSIPRYVQASKYFVVLAPCVKHVDTGDLMSKESWQSRGWCRVERVCREFLCPDSNIAVIESPQHWYVMTPFVCMRFLIEQRADLNFRDSLGHTALHRASIGDNSEGLQILLEAGCNPYHLDTFGNNALVPACGWGSVHSIRTLIAHVPDIDFGAALHFAVLGEGAPEETIPELLLAGVDINAPMPLSRKMRFQFRLLARLAKWLDRHHGTYIFFFLTNVIGATPLIISLLSRSFHAAATVS